MGKRNYTVDRSRVTIQPPCREELARLYLKQELGMSGIASIYGVSVDTVRRWLNDYEIPVRPPPPKTPVPDIDTLRHLYETQRLSMREIGALYGVSGTVVAKWFKALGVASRTHGRKPSKSEMEQLYPRLSLQQAARHVGVGVVRFRRWLEEDKIELRPGQPKYEKPNIEELRWLYEDEGLSLEEIALLLDCGASATTIRNWLIEGGVKMRSPNVKLLSPDHKELRKALEDGLSKRQMRERFDVSSLSVLNRWLKDADLYEPMTTTELDEAAIIVLYKSGLSARQIAEQSGTSHGRICGILERADIPRERQRPGYRSGMLEPPDPDLLRRLYLKDKFSLQEIGEMFGCSGTTVATWLRSLGVERRNGGWHPSRTCSDGHQVRSAYEYRVCELFHRYGVLHEYEPRLEFARRYRADFLVEETFIEVWGVKNVKTYQERKLRKIELYRQNGANLIELEPEDFLDVRWLLALGPLLPGSAGREVSASLDRVLN